MRMKVKKGEIYLIDLGKRIGSEQGGIRPGLVIQNNIGNKYSPTVIIATITSKTKNNLPTHFFLQKGNGGIKENSTVLFEQILTVDKTRLIRKVGEVTATTLSEMDKCAMVSLGLN